MRLQREGFIKTAWPSGLRRWLKAPFRKGVGSSPTALTCRWTVVWSRSQAGAHRERGEAAAAWCGSRAREEKQQQQGARAERESSLSPVSLQPPSSLPAASLQLLSSLSPCSPASPAALQPLSSWKLVDAPARFAAGVLIPGMPEIRHLDIDKLSKRSCCLGDFPKPRENSMGPPPTISPLGGRRLIH